MKTAIFDISKEIERRLGNIKKSKGYDFNMFVYQGRISVFSDKNIPYCYYFFDNDRVSNDEYGRCLVDQDVMVRSYGKIEKIEDMDNYHALLATNITLALNRSPLNPKPNDKPSSKLGKLATSFNYNGSIKYVPKEPIAKSNIWVGIMAKYEMKYRININDLRTTV